MFIAHSKKTHDATDTDVTAIAPNPKYMKEHIKAGMSAIHTPNMFFLTESPPWICGDNDNLNLFIVLILSVGSIFILCCDFL